MKPRKQREYSDIETYRRLLRYLRGTGLVIAFLVLCMVLEALCTVGTISLVKPMVDLLLHGKLVDDGHLKGEATPFEFGLPNFGEDGIAGTAATGLLAGQKAAATLQSTVDSLLDRKPRTAIIDLSRVAGIDEHGWAALGYAGLKADRSGIRTIAVLPASQAPPSGLTTSASRLETMTTATISAEVSAALTTIPVPAPPRIKNQGFIARVKQSAIDRAMPLIRAIEAASQGNLFKVLAGLVGVMILFAVGVTVFGFLVGYISSWLGSWCVLQLRNHVWEHMMGLDMSYFTKQSVGTNMSVVTQDVGAVSNAIDVLFSGVLKTPITIAVLVAAMIVVSPKLTIFCLTIVPILSLVVLAVGRRVRRISVKVQQQRAEMSGSMNEVFTGIRVVKAYNMENREIEKFREQSHMIFRTGLRGRISEEIGTGLTGLFGFITIGAVILAGGYTVLGTGELSGSDFALFIGLLSQVFRPLKSVNKTNARIQRGLAGCDRVFHVLESRPRIKEKSDAVTLSPLQRGIVFENVSFGYDRHGGWVLRNIDLTVPCGKVIALVGETGAGKSTLVNLLPRFYDPVEGRILWDGTDIRDAVIKSLRAHIGVITQEVILFDDTVANNIAYGCEGTVPQERIVAAAMAANAHKFITEKLPKGYETQIGSRGIRLSGGERQRIAIARAILKNAPVLILDEATSSLDSETEALVQDALIQVMAGRTVFVIAHRLSTVHNADEIIVMENGRFAERGTHEELMALAGRYARYYNIQFKQKQAAGTG